MEWLSKDFGLCYKPPKRGVFDVLIVGSGYGGAVAASRMARARRKKNGADEAGPEPLYSEIAVLERGREFVPGEFPNDIANLPGQVRLQRWDVEGMTGNPNGLFDIHYGFGLATLVGNALGGTSQINANVAMRADPKIFTTSRWPAALRDMPDPLDVYYERVARALDARPVSDRREPPPKLRALARLARELGANTNEPCDDFGAIPARDGEPLFVRPPLAVTPAAAENADSAGRNPQVPVATVRLPEPRGAETRNNVGVLQSECLNCGDCVTGCNHAAKNTLTMNYLPDAYRQGATIYTGATVVGVFPARHRRRPRDTAKWEVVVLRSGQSLPYGLDDAEMRKWLNGRENGARRSIPLRTERVILAAGTLGSTEILLRSRQLYGLPVSSRLGHAFSANGDDLWFGFNQDSPVHAIGWGAYKRAEKYSEGGAKEERGEKHEEKPKPGPTITALIDMRPMFPPCDERAIVVEDGIIPGALRDLLHEILTTGALLHRLGDCRSASAKDDPAAIHDRELEHTQVYLSMGHDTASGRIRLQNHRAYIDWPEFKNDPVHASHERVRRVAAKLGGVVLQNPSEEETLVWQHPDNDPGSAPEALLAQARAVGRRLIESAPLPADAS